MEVILSPSENIQVGLPISVVIRQSSGVPRAYVRELGEIPLKKSKEFYNGEFWTAASGPYQLKVDDLTGSYTKEFTVGPSTQLEFSQEFLPFFLGTLILTVIVFKWSKRSWKDKNKSV